MSYKYILFIVLFSPIFNAFSQENKAEKKYTEYFNLPRETLFLHLNKTTYLTGEEIWFKAYAYDRKSHLSSKATSNIYIHLYDADGNLVKQGLFLASNGTAKGNIAIAPSINSGDYYIKAATNWMKNFDEDDSYVQKIKILNPAQELPIEQKKVNDFDVQFLPEGGHIVAGIKNTIGFKCLDTKGRGAKISGVLLDEKNEEVTTFSSNFLGLGKFVFVPEKGQRYTAKITTQGGDTFTKELYRIKGRGINIMLNTNDANTIVATLQTNEETFKEIANDDYKLLIHKDGELKTIPFQFKSAKSKTITIPKKELFKGVNTITLFNSANTPILERLFFNDFNIKDIPVKVTLANTKQDSIHLVLKSPNQKDFLNLSVSVLPENTQSYYPKHSIESAFYLQPYLKGTIENASYYFTKIDRKKKYELDILLLTQGWSRYNWDKIFSGAPKVYYDFENGVTIHGNINYPIRNVDSLFLYPTKYHKSQTVKVDDKKSFKIPNFYPENGEEIRLSYFTNKGMLRKPKLYLRSSVNNALNTFDIASYSAYPSREYKPITNYSIPKNFFYEDRELLDEIAITSKKKEEKISKPLSYHDNVQRIDEKLATRYTYVTDYIESKGYRVTTSNGDVAIYSPNPASHRGLEEPTIYVDGALLFESSWNILGNFRMIDVEEVLVNKSGLGYGMNGRGGVIKITTRRTPLIKRVTPKSNSFAKNKIHKGFEATKEFYTPKYASYLNNTFENYGVIHWEPYAYVSDSYEFSLKISNTKTKVIKLFIEGVSEDGNLISEIKTITVN